MWIGLATRRIDPKWRISFFFSETSWRAVENRSTINQRKSASENWWSTTQKFTTLSPIGAQIRRPNGSMDAQTGSLRGPVHKNIKQRHRCVGKWTVVIKMSTSFRLPSLHFTSWQNKNVAATSCRRFKCFGRTTFRCCWMSIVWQSADECHRVQRVKVWHPADRSASFKTLGEVFLLKS